MKTRMSLNLDWSCVEEVMVKIPRGYTLGNPVFAVSSSTSTQVSTRLKVLLSTQSRGIYRELNSNITPKK